MKWLHETTILIPVGPEGGEDEVEVEVRLHLSGHAGRPARIRWDELDHPGEAPEMELERFDLLDHKRHWYAPDCYEKLAFLPHIEAWLEDPENIVHCFESLSEKESSDEWRMDGGAAGCGARKGPP